MTSGNWAFFYPGQRVCSLIYSYCFLFLIMFFLSFRWSLLINTDSSGHGDFSFFARNFWLFAFPCVGQHQLFSIDSQNNTLFISFECSCWFVPLLFIIFHWYFFNTIVKWIKKIKLQKKIHKNESTNSFTSSKIVHILYIHK